MSWQNENKSLQLVPYPGLWYLVSHDGKWLSAKCERADPANPQGATGPTKYTFRRFIDGEIFETTAPVVFRHRKYHAIADCIAAGLNKLEAIIKLCQEREYQLAPGTITGYFSLYSLGKWDGQHQTFPASGVTGRPKKQPPPVAQQRASTPTNNYELLVAAKNFVKLAGGFDKALDALTELQDFLKLSN
jgi:hypothetical protein